jgi:hypothetical protein
MRLEMNISPEIMKKYVASLPVIKSWIHDLLASHESSASPVIGLASQRILKSFPHDFLERVRVVTLAGNPPFPPLSRMGLHEFFPMERMQLAGVTYKETYFVRESSLSESLHFHELVHAVQWNRLGMDNFLLAYGVGIIQYGYAKSPFEQMASSLQNSFELSAAPRNILDLINRQTDEIWNGVKPLVPQR